MPEIKCPKCGEVFTVDESGYAAISAQVRDEEFHKALHERLSYIEKEKQSELFNKIQSEPNKYVLKSFKGKKNDLTCYSAFQNPGITRVLGK